MVPAQVGGAEDAIADEAARNYAPAFPGLLGVDVRYQGNRILVGGAAPGDMAERAAAAAERLGWRFDPRSRLGRVKRM